VRGSISVQDYLLSLHFNGIFPGEPGLASSTKASDDVSGGDNWSCKLCKKQSSGQIVTTNKPIPDFLQAGCPSCNQTTVSKHWKQCSNYYL